MKVLVYRYGSICEPDIMEELRRLKLEVDEETAEMEDKGLTPSRCVDIVAGRLEKEAYLFVFSINFFPALAKVCRLYQVNYVCWTVDAPVFELFSEAIRLDTNRIFLFDRAQYKEFHPYNPKRIHYLPLAAAAKRFDRVVQSISAQDRERFGGDISFVGSLYSEKNPMNGLDGLPGYARGYIQGMAEASLKVMGYNFMEEIIPEKVVQALQEADPSFYRAGDTVRDCASYVAAHGYAGSQAAEMERTRTLNRLAERFRVDLYTGSDASALSNVRVHGKIKTLTQMPKVFHLSKINLNMTIKPIQTGLPLRIFDILGCGGFLMTNYQEELTEYFSLGVEAEAYTGVEELVEKCAYYLSHETQRAAIARRGYEKVKRCHSYANRLAEIFRKSF